MAPPLGLAFALSESEDADPSLLTPPPAALGARLWVGQRMPGGPDATPVGPLRRLMLADLPAPDALGFEPAPGFALWRGTQILPGAALAPKAAGALLLNIMNIDPGHEDEFNDWYDTEHMPRIGATPGVLAARRFRAIDGAPRYAAFYHLARRDIAQQEPWMSAAETPWTRRIQRFRTDSLRLSFLPA